MLGSDQSFTIQDWLAQDPFAIAEQPPDPTEAPDTECCITGTRDASDSEEGDDDDDDSSDDYVKPRKQPPRAAKPSEKKREKKEKKTTTRKKQPPPKAKEKPPVRKPPVRPRLTEAQKAENKRKRDEDRTMLNEMREFLAESTKRQKSQREQIESASITPPPVQSSQSDYIMYLSATVANQQAMISNLNTEIFNLGANHRHALAEADLRHREEVDELRATIQAQREHDAALQLRINEWRVQRARMMDEMERLRNGIQASAQLLLQQQQPQQQQQQQVAPQSNNEPTAKPQRLVKTEPGQRALDSATHYTWLVVEERSPRCEELYGFTAQQLVELNQHISGAGFGPRLGRGGAKPTYSENQGLLVVLYHFTLYTTTRDVHEKFGISTTTVSTLIAKFLKEGAANALFHHSMPPLPVAAYSYAAYFLAVQTPLDAQIARAMYNKEAKQHGVWIHCMHCAESDKVVAYYCSNLAQLDEEWAAKLVPRADATHGAYGRRLRGKFGFFTSRFRGCLQDLDANVRCLLALANLDLGYDNAIREHVTIEL